MPDRKHDSHVTRFSFDASSYDEVCINCGATDHIGGWGKLALPCPHNNSQMDSVWKEYEADFNALTDEEIEVECEYERRKLEEAESWLEAVELWKRAGKPRSKD